MLIRESILNRILKKRFKSTFSLGSSKKIAMRFESQIIDSDSRQALVWIPAIKNVPAHFVRSLNHYNLSHVIHFTTGHNNLLRHRCKLAGGEVMCGGE